MDRLNAMRTFARVIDAGSFAGAARQMDVSPAVVTRLVADLEGHLRTRLIQRTTRSLALTGIGQAYLARVREILDRLEDAEAIVNDASSQPRGALRVIAAPAFAMHQLAKELPRFKALYPQVALELTVDGPVTTVDEAHDVSIIGVPGDALQGDFVARRLASYEVLLCAAPAYLAQHGLPLHPRELGRHECLVPRSVRELTLRRLNAPDERAIVTVSGSMLGTLHVGAMHAAALAGVGIAPLPSFMVQGALADGTLVQVLPDWHLFNATFFAAVPTRKHLPAKVRVFIDFLVQALPPAMHDRARRFDGPTRRASLQAAAQLDAPAQARELA